MGKKDPRIDAYIAKQKEFARPILTHIRDVIHEGCPEVEETLKWSSPTFMYHGIMAGMAGFKEHAIFGFWKHTLLLKTKQGERAAGSYGRLTSLKDLPPKKEMIALVKKAMALNEKGVVAPRLRTMKAKKGIPMHPVFKAALAKNKKATAQYEAFSPSKKHEYLEWIADAKADDTRARRVEQAVGWIAEGKSRNWKYR
jgi:uncharacterized protein YdeI (YjbR/CyaY-like superfamily)